MSRQKETRYHSPSSVYAFTMTKDGETNPTIEFVDSDGRTHRVMLSEKTFEQLSQTMARESARMARADMPRSAAGNARNKDSK